MKDVNALRHEKEKTYFNVMLVVSIIVWVLCSLAVLGFLIAGLPVVLFAVFIAWLSGLYFKAVVFGNSVHVNEKQFPELYEIATKQAAELGLSKCPMIFVENGDGLVNAFAVRRLSKKYVILQSNLVDLMLSNGRMDELSVIIGHELAHHAAGHVAFFRNLLIAPGRIIPFIGAAYGRACELTADRIGYALVGKKEAAEKALIAIALGSRALKEQANTQAFMAQEEHIPSFMGFIHKIFSSHPRMTRRVIEIEKYSGL